MNSPEERNMLNFLWRERCIYRYLPVVRCTYVACGQKLYLIDYGKENDLPSGETNLIACGVKDVLP